MLLSAINIRPTVVIVLIIQLYFTLVFVLNKFITSKYNKYCCSNCTYYTIIRYFSKWLSLLLVSTIAVTVVIVFIIQLYVTLVFVLIKLITSKYNKYCCSKCTYYTIIFTCYFSKCTD